MLKISIALIVAFGCNYSRAFSQTETNVSQEKIKKIQLFSNGGYGKYISLDKATQTAQSGDVYFFQLQINYRKNYFARLAFDQYNIGYAQNTITSGLNFTIKDKIQTTNVGIDIGYIFQLSKKISPYLYIGAGRASMQVPTLYYDSTRALADIAPVKKPFLSLRAGTGCDYEFTKMFIAFVEIQYLSIPFKTDISNKKLNGMSFQIGFKTRLQ